MKLIKIKQNERPFSRVWQAIMDMERAGRERVVIHDFNDEGDVRFSVTLSDLGLTVDDVDGCGLFKNRAFINFLGEMLVRTRLPVFLEILQLTQKTDEMLSGCRSHDFGMKLNMSPEVGNYPYEEDAEDPPPVMEFSFHVSLLDTMLEKTATS